MNRDEKAREEQKQKVDDKLKALQDAKCVWPECEKKNDITCSLPLLRVLESGALEAAEGMMLGFPFCMAHSMYAMSGLVGVIENKEQQERYELHAPFEMFRVCEAVNMAYRMSEMKEKGAE